uniref:Uncharacterized protein n=1 Tax=Trichuris muris TaxID=70415 RepID=A0A5S6QQW7_TRIMR
MGIGGSKRSYNVSAYNQVTSDAGSTLSERKNKKQGTVDEQQSTGKENAQNHPSEAGPSESMVKNSAGTPDKVKG